MSDHREPHTRPAGSCFSGVVAVLRREPGQPAGRVVLRDGAWCYEVLCELDQCEAAGLAFAKGVIATVHGSFVRYRRS